MGTRRNSKNNFFKKRYAIMNSSISIKWLRSPSDQLVIRLVHNFTLYINVHVFTLAFHANIWRMYYPLKFPGYGPKACLQTRDYPPLYTKGCWCWYEHPFLNTSLGTPKSPNNPPYSITEVLVQGPMQLASELDLLWPHISSWTNPTLTRKGNFHQSLLSYSLGLWKCSGK